jgi:hypothetical protein
MNDFSNIIDRDDLHSIIWDIAKDAALVVAQEDLV